MSKQVKYLEKYENAQYQAILVSSIGAINDLVYNTTDKIKESVDTKKLAYYDREMIVGK